ncbi:DUF445 domain-containing protein [Verrucomicrobiaceae bacterium R5-34]|nr:DUF445 domain-containing protein [Verrucomicrobiaceae bacterium R5-34]
MTDLPNPRLKRMRLAAGAILALMAMLYVFARSYQTQWPWLEWLRAFAEAGMVGGLADWFAVTALFRHPLGLPIPHTAVIPKEKDRIGAALAQFVRGNFLTAALICQQAKELMLVPRMASWMTQPANADKLAQQTLQMLPTALDALEKNDAHKLLTSKLTEQLKTVRPDEISGKLLDWMLAEQRYRKLLAPVLRQLSSAISHNRGRIEEAAGNKAPLNKVPLLGRISRAIAEDISERTTGSIEAKLIAASEDETEPLWDIIDEQLTAAREQFSNNPELRSQLESIRDQWLEDPHSGELAERLWQQVRRSLDRDLQSEVPKTVDHLSSIIVSAGTAIDHNPELAQRIENTLLEGIDQILTQHGEHIEAMIRNTIEQWDAATLIQKLEQQVGPDLQFIRINGTLIGGLVGVSLHAIGLLIWH